MVIGVLVTFTLVCISWSLWIRWVTWTCRWEVAATLNIALQGVAVLLMSPLASKTLGHWLYDLTGRWNLEDFIAHDCYIVAASAVVYNALGRLGDNDVFRAKFKQAVEYPATLCIPLLLVVFSVGNGVAVYRPDFFQVPTDFWLNIYWLLLCGTLIHLLIYASRALIVLRRDLRSRRVATVYLVALGSGMLSCLIRVVTAFTPLQGLGQGASLAVWLPSCLCGTLFAVISAQTWRTRISRFIRPREMV